MRAPGKPKPKPKPGRGGLRSPAGGRPRERGRDGINWAQVRRFARLGADRDDIVDALGIPPEALRDPDTIARMQQEMRRGQALHKIDLLAHAERLRKGGDGSVNAVLAGLRQKLGYDRPDSAKGREQHRPDAEAAVAELERLIRRAEFNAPR